jgi:hypothetical protein
MSEDAKKEQERKRGIITAAIARAQIKKWWI